ncbi:MAG: hypothetical protein JNL72_09285 [Flavipsychrobacter sp.]|nr:hypothetical protein [Flavipsychrobacter sp.]
MKSKFIPVALACLFFSIQADAQAKKYSDKEYAKEPLWVEMLDDTTANFFEVEKAFNIYFQHNEMPSSEHDMIGEHAEREKNPSKKKQLKIEQDSHLRRQVKKYHRWHEKMLPYVQPDGRILTPTERLAIWQQVKDENNKR